MDLHEFQHLSPDSVMTRTRNGQLILAYSGWLAEIAIGKHGLILFLGRIANKTRTKNLSQSSLGILGGSPVHRHPPSPLRATERPPWQK